MDTQPKDEWIELHLTKSEYSDFSLYCYHFAGSFISKRDKVVVFHYSGINGFSITHQELHNFFMAGYQFATCFPKSAKENLGYGNFLWDEWDKETQNRPIGAVFNNSTNDDDFIVEIHKLPVLLSDEEFRKRLFNIRSVIREKAGLKSPMGGLSRPKRSSLSAIFWVNT